MREAAMSTIDELVPLLKKLRLSGVLQSLELRLKQAREDNLPYEEFLFRLLSDEVERRDGKQLEQRVRRANFEHARTLEDFDFHFNPNVPKAKVIDLATCGFIDQRQNVLLLGPTGVGKSHIAQSLGHRACRLGKSVLYVAAQDLFKQLRAARADGSHDRRLLRFTTPDLLIIDDLGLRPLRDDEPVDLYEIIRARYERHSTLITSNRTASEMGELFGDPLLATAPPWIACSTTHTSSSSTAPHSETRRPNGESPRRTRTRRPQHDEPTAATGGSAWPICTLRRLHPERRMAYARSAWICLADLVWLHEADR
jgi:DNA replication protein DnaC